MHCVHYPGLREKQNNQESTIHQKILKAKGRVGGPGMPKRKAQLFQQLSCDQRMSHTGALFYRELKKNLCRGQIHWSMGTVLPFQVERVMHWWLGLCFVIVSKSLKVWWVCSYTLPCCSLSDNMNFKNSGFPLSTEAYIWLPSQVVILGDQHMSKCNVVTAQGPWAEIS